MRLIAPKRLGVGDDCRQGAFADLSLALYLGSLGTNLHVDYLDT